jgi:hypothetical protein
MIWTGYEVLWRENGSKSLTKPFYVRSQNFEKRLLASSRLSVHPHEKIPTGQIFMKFYVEVYFENMSRKFKLIKIWQEKQVLYKKISFIYDHISLSSS